MEAKLINDQCFICKKKCRKSVASIKKIWPQKKDVLFCNRCKLYFLKEMPSEDELHFYYNQYYHYSFIQNIFKKLFRYFRSSSQFDYISKTINKDNYNDFTILEIGACDGTLLNFFKKRGANVKGTEFSEEFNNYSMKKYKISLDKIDFFRINGKFDLIIMSHVFEHMTQPEEVLKKISTILKKNGVCFFEFPNSPGINDAILLKQYLNTAHTLNFSLKSAAKMLSNFRILDIGRFYYNLDFIKSSRDQRVVAENLLTGKNTRANNIIKLVKYIFYSALQPSKSSIRLNPNKEYAGLGENIRIIYGQNNSK